MDSVKNSQQGKTVDKDEKISWIDEPFGILGITFA